eukprot:6197232-Pleurochrysis_carterae.AAC.1
MGDSNNARENVRLTSLEKIDERTTDCQMAASAKKKSRKPGGVSGGCIAASRSRKSNTRGKVHRVFER